MRDGGGDEGPRGGGEPAAAIEIIARRAQGEQVVDVEYKPEKQVQATSSLSSPRVVVRAIFQQVSKSSWSRRPTVKAVHNLSTVRSNLLFLTAISATDFHYICNTIICIRSSLDRRRLHWSPLPPGHH